MAVLTVRNVSDEVHRALRTRAAEHGRSTEAEVRAILEAAVKPADRVRVGDALCAIGRKLGLTDKDIGHLEKARRKGPAEPLELE